MEFFIGREGEADSFFVLPREEPIEIVDGLAIKSLVTSENDGSTESLHVGLFAAQVKAVGCSRNGMFVPKNVQSFFQFMFSGSRLAP